MWDVQVAELARPSVQSHLPPGSCSASVHGCGDPAPARRQAAGARRAGSVRHRPVTGAPRAAHARTFRTSRATRYSTDSQTFGGTPLAERQALPRTVWNAGRSVLTYNSRHGVAGVPGR